MSKYHFAVGKKSIVSYNDQFQVIERLEDCFIDLYYIKIRNHMMEIKGSLESISYPEELCVYVKTGGRTYHCDLEKNEKLHFSTKIPIEECIDKKITFFISYKNEHIKMALKTNAQGNVSQNKRVLIDTQTSSITVKPSMIKSIKMKIKKLLSR